MKRGYKKPDLFKIATELPKIGRRTLLEYREKYKRITLLLT